MVYENNEESELKKYEEWLDTFEPINLQSNYFDINQYGCSIEDQIKLTIERILYFLSSINEKPSLVGLEHNENNLYILSIKLGKMVSAGRLELSKYKIDINSQPADSLKSFKATLFSDRISSLSNLVDYCDKLCSFSRYLLIRENDLNKHTNFNQAEREEFRKHYKAYDEKYCYLYLYKPLTERLEDSDFSYLLNNKNLVRKQ